MIVGVTYTNLYTLRLEKQQKMTTAVKGKKGFQKLPKSKKRTKGVTIYFSPTEYKELIKLLEMANYKETDLADFIRNAIFNG